MGTRWRALVATGAVAALVAGCGGDEESIEPIGESAPAETESADGKVSQREFIAAADARCSEANAAIANLGTGAAAENLMLVTSQERQITSGVRDALADLGDPPDPDGALEDYLDALDEQVAVLRRMEQAADNGDTAYEQLSGELAEAKSAARAAAEEYGFRSCGQDGRTRDGEDPGASPPDASGGDGPSSSDPAPAPAPPPAPGESAPPPSSGGTGGGGGGGGPGGSGGSGGIGAG